MVFKRDPVGNDRTTENDGEDVYDEVHGDDSPVEIDQDAQDLINGVEKEAELDDPRIDQYLEYERIRVRTKPDNLFFIKEFYYFDPDETNSRYFNALSLM